MLIPITLDVSLFYGVRIERTLGGKRLYVILVTLKTLARKILSLVVINVALSWKL